MSAEKRQAGTAARFGGSLSPSSWGLTVWVAVIGFVITALIGGWSWQRSTRQGEELLASHGQVLAGSVAEAFDEVVERLIGVGSLYQSSEEVTGSEFRLFTASFEPIGGMGGIGYAPIVPARDLAAFEADVGKSIPEYEVFEFDSEGNRVPVLPRSSYVPVQWFEPADAFDRPHGFDAASEAERRRALNEARTTGEATATSFLQLVSEVEADGFLVYWPVTDPDSGTVMGFTFAPMDLGGLLTSQIPAALSDALEWAISDLTSGPPPPPIPEEAWTTVLGVGGRQWRLTVTPTEASQVAADITEPVLIILVGLVASFLAAVGVHFYRRKIETQAELDQLRELTRAKEDEFLASVGHELRTPLTGVLGFAELIRENRGDLSESERRTMIRHVAEEASDLAGIIDDLLVAARSELDLLAITRVPVSLRAQALQVLEANNRAACERVELVGEHDSEFRAAGDPARVRQIIRNLVSNACRYGGERIQIRFAVRDGFVCLDVADNGRALPDDDLERIFEAYYKRQQDSTQPATLGIGLSVARQLAELMYGDLTCHREDAWNVFRLTLPVVTEIPVSRTVPQSTAAAHRS